MRGLLERLLARHREAADEGVTDSELLRRFTRDRDEAAFELLVWRHGGMVLGLCQRAIRDEQLAEDAFQAVFLVLARKAGAVRGNLGGWLFRVARRVATRAAARHSPAHPVTETVAGPNPDLAERQELTDLLDAEVARLPERLRKPVVLCYLGGHSTEDAARELGCPRGTVLSRLATARTRLAERLARRGVALPAAISVAGVSLTGRIVSSAAISAHRFRLGSYTPDPATTLANGVIQTMNRGTLITAFGGTLLAVTLVSGVGWVAAQQGTRTEPAGDVTAPVANANAEPVNATPKPSEPREPTEDKKVLDERVKKLETQASLLKEQIREQERSIDEYAEAIDKHTRRRAASIRHFDEVEAEYQKLSREIVKMEAELTVLKKRVEKPAPLEPDSNSIQNEMSRDARIMTLSDKLQVAQNELNKAVLLSTGQTTPVIQALKGNVAELEKSLEAVRHLVRGEVVARLKTAVTQALRERVAKLSIELEIQKEILKALETKLNSSAATVSSTASDAHGVLAMQKTREADCVALRDVLARVQAEITRLQLQREGIVAPRTEGTEAKLDLLIREIAELRKKVRELKSKK